jgi:uncharacterized protein YlxW (UPF0749 family)
MSYHNPKLALPEVLIFLLVLASGLSFLNPIFAVSVVAVACLFAVVHLAQHHTLRQQKAELTEARILQQDALDSYHKAVNQTEKLSEQVANMQAQIDALRSANAISFGGRK